MALKIEFDINYDDIIDVLNFFDQKNINIDYDKDGLYCDLIINKRYDEIDYFIDRGVSLHKFLSFCSDEEDIDVINYLIERDLDSQKDPEQILIGLIKSKYYDAAEEFIEKCNKNDETYIDINYSQGKILREAVRTGNKKFVKVLFKNKAKVKKCKQDPLIDALFYNQIHLIKMLLEKGSKMSSIKPCHLEKCIENHDRRSINFIVEKITDGELDHFKDYDLLPCLESACSNTEIQESIKIIFALASIDGVRNLIISNRDDLESFTQSNYLISFLRTFKMRESPTKHKKSDRCSYLKRDSSGVTL